MILFLDYWRSLFIANITGSILFVYYSPCTIERFFIYSSTQTRIMKQACQPIPEKLQENMKACGYSIGGASGTFGAPWKHQGSTEKGIYSPTPPICLLRTCCTPAAQEILTFLYSAALSSWQYTLLLLTNSGTMSFILATMRISSRVASSWCRSPYSRSTSSSLYLRTSACMILGW